MREIVIATKNKGKIKEIEQVFAGLPIKVLSLAEFGNVPEAVEDGATFIENACKKAEFYAAVTGKACLADDSGLEVDALNGEPGVYSARYAGEKATDAENNQKLIAELTEINAVGSTARFRCALAFCDNDGSVITCDGTCEGKIIDRPQGSNGFGYDPYFFVPELNKTLAQVSMEEKNVISHRGRALRKMAERLAE